MEKKKPIGIFDSGVGGLSIARSIRRELPCEDLLYVADQGFYPYGSKPKQVIEQRSARVADFLSEQGCKAIVVACNTATVNAIESLRAKLKIPVVGVEPGIKPAALHSKTGVIGVLATEQTLKSRSFQSLKAKFSGQVEVEMQACPRLVELVEAVNLDSDETTEVVENYVRPLLSKGADHIVLGCTHFSFLSPVIERAFDGRATLIDTASPVAKELKRRLAQVDLLHSRAAGGDIKFWSSNASRQATESISRLWGASVSVSEIRKMNS